MGYGFFGDSTYHLMYEIEHSADSLVLEFASDLFEGKGTDDESWGLDNVKVTVGTGKPSTLKSRGQLDGPAALKQR
jgi:hypothetical protein